MTLTFTVEETEELRAALVQARAELLGRTIKAAGPGSTLSIDLSRRQIRLQGLLNRLSQPPGPPTAARPTFRSFLTAIA